MELLSPAGNLEKLTYAYLYGADAAYIGLGNFSLRAKADNFHLSQFSDLERIKGGNKLYLALNIYFHDRDIRELEELLTELKNAPFDGIIVSDFGILPLLQKHLSGMEFHLSTQANCVNTESARIYHDMGFSRIIPGRELTLDEIAEIKQRVPSLEIEVFVHGAMCLAYSGRCFLSAYLSGRSGNRGDCAHSCRWNYRVLEEQERPGEYFPLVEGEEFTTILSSKDLCMIEYMNHLKEAGVDSCKIEGRMKSLYYTAIVTRAYRKAIDALSGLTSIEISGFKEELYKVSHREFSTGFFFGKEDIQVPTKKSYMREYIFLGTFAEKVRGHTFRIDVKNSIRTGDVIEYIGPDVLFIEDRNFQLFDAHWNPACAAHHGKVFYLKTGCNVGPGFIIRSRIPEPAVQPPCPQT